MLIFGFDPGKTGAWGAITHNGDYHACGDTYFDERGILTEKMWAEICMARDGQDCQVIVELVHSMPRDGVRSAFAFGSAYGATLALAQRFNCTWHMVTPQRWKKALQLDSDKQKSLDLARELWPNAPLSRKKDNGRAEALLLAEYLRREQQDV